MDHKRCELKNMYSETGGGWNKVPSLKDSVSVHLFELNIHVLYLCHIYLLFLASYLHSINTRGFHHRKDLREKLQVLSVGLFVCYPVKVDTIRVIFCMQKKNLQALTQAARVVGDPRSLCSP